MRKFLFFQFILLSVALNVVRAPERSGDPDLSGVSATERDLLQRTGRSP